MEFTRAWCVGAAGSVLLAPMCVGRVQVVSYLPRVIAIVRKGTLARRGTNGAERQRGPHSTRDHSPANHIRLAACNRMHPLVPRCSVEHQNRPSRQMHCNLLQHRMARTSSFTTIRTVFFIGLLLLFNPKLHHYIRPKADACYGMFKGRVRVNVRWDPSSWSILVDSKLVRPI
jgi:hypothetical protein